MFSTAPSSLLKAAAAVGFSALAFASLAGTTGCGEKKFKGAMILSGQKVSSEKLEHGREVYVHYCRACHGDDGDGNGASVKMGLRPPPRDFRAGQFKFGSVAGGLPSDEDFKRIIKHGLKGTAMLPWDLDEPDLDAVIQYIKTFSPRWQPPKFKQGAAVVPSRPDPWIGAREVEGIARGKYVYHQKAQCGSCHPNYVTRNELSSFNMKDTGAPITEFRDDMYGSVLKESQYKVDAKLDAKGEYTGGYPIKLLPPDFVRDDVRSVRMFSRETALEDLYRVIAGGINGTPMPQWKGTVFEPGHDSDDDIWALAHFVYDLIKMKGTPAAIQWRMQMSAQPAWVPPVPTEPPTTPPPETTGGTEAPTMGSAPVEPTSAPLPSTTAGVQQGSSPTPGGGEPSAKPSSK
jgi:mono/diheme cytochrome c family protein